MMEKQSSELTVVNTTKLTNGKLKVQVGRINSAIKTNLRNGWDMATAVNIILTNELFAEDFKTEKEFAEYLGISRPQLNKLKRVVGVRDILVKYDTDVFESFTASKMSELLPINEEELILFVKTLGVDSTWSALDLRESVKEWIRCTEELADSEQESDELEESEELEEAEESTESVPSQFSVKVVDTEYMVSKEILDKIMELLK